MSGEQLAGLRQAMFQRLPKRHIYLRSGGDVRSFAISTADQIIVLACLAALGAWTLFATGMLVTTALSNASQATSLAKTQAYYERLIADRQARLNLAVARLSTANGAMDGLAKAVTERHAALAMLLSDVKGAPGAFAALVPLKPALTANKRPADQVQAVERDQERLAEAAESYAKSRADRLRLAFRLAGLNPASFSNRVSGASALGGPLIEATDPRALAAVLDVSEDFAGRIQRAAKDLDAMRALGEEAKALPLSEPLANPVRSSPFGVRIDPITHSRAFHPGQDFAGGFMTPVYSTAPGVVSFTGQRTGYGNVVEIDHGGGFKTRYAHLQAISVGLGQRVGLAQHVGGMGSTGRSTGVHLHYEVWQNGRLQDPARFLKAGDYIRQND